MEALSVLEKQLASSSGKAGAGKTLSSLQSAHPSTDSLANQALRDGSGDQQQESAAIGLLKTHVVAWRKLACRRLLAPGALLPVPEVEADTREALKRDAIVSVTKKGIFDVYW
jgi:hypothetical protein